MKNKLLSKNQIEICQQVLDECYQTARPMLNFSTSYELLVAVILSAQCRDERVNSVTEGLFLKANTPIKMLELGESSLSEIIKPCGLFRNKSANIIKASSELIERFNGQVPSTFDELISLSGVGRKTANVVLSVGFGVPAIAVDTHVFRVSNRLGLANGKTPLDVENRLMKIFRKENWLKLHHQLIFHGRQVCMSQSPKCEICMMNDFCLHYQNKKKKLKV